MRDRADELSIVFLIDGLGTGGAERSLAELLPLLREAGVRTTIVTFFARAQGVEDSVRADGFDVRRITAKRLPSRVIQLRRLLRRQRVDLLHTTLFEATMVGRLAVIGTRVPVLTSLVNTTYDRTRRDRTAIAAWRLGLVRWIDRITARRTSHFHAISEAVATDARAGLGLRASDITVIGRGRSRMRLGEPSAERRTAARAGLGLSDHQPVVLAVGRQEEQKGHRYLIDAMEGVLARFPDATLLLAGRPGAATAMVDAAVARASAPERIRLLGHRDDVGDLLAAADVFAFPSLWEGLGGAVVEALAMGLPVVASDLAVFREFLDDGAAGNCVLVAPQDAGALSAAIVEVLDDPDRRAAMSARSRAIFDDRFTLEATAPRMIDLIRDTARRPR